jgi:serine/threonine-protein phosphatase 2A regulatory subunit B'
MLMNMDQEIFQECQRRFHEEETKAIHTQKKHEMTWQYLEAVAASKALSCRFVSCAHWILQVLDS